MASRGLVLITGASAGIGREFARGFAERGFDLFLVARRLDRLEELAAELRTHYGVSVTTLAVDLAHPAAAATVDGELQARGLAVYVLVNNAGTGRFGPFVSVDSAALERTIDVNVRSLTLLTRALLPGMLARGRGRILNVASTAAFQPGPLMAVYYATKAFVLSLSEALTNECAGSGVTVTCLCPGPTESEFMEAAGIDDTTLRRTGWLMTARSVAEAGIRGALDGRRLVVPGFVNRAIAFSVRLAPRSWVLRVSRAVQERGR